ncbi:MAG TPA: dihydroneopterin aldolase [Flavisolibacter sp.]
MTSTFTIELRGLRFFAEHGLYREEILVGNEFEADVFIVSQAPAETVTSLDQTVNYVDVYQIVQEAFSTHSHLLETLAMQIADRVEATFSSIVSFEICIRKLNPPITNFTGSVAVRYHRQVR